jgi:hypothetical protein
MVTVYDLNSGKYRNVVFIYNTIFGNQKQITYTGKTEQRETRDWSGNRKMETKYIFIDLLTQQPISLTPTEVVSLVPIDSAMGGRMLRRQRTQRRGRQQKRQRTQRRQKAQRKSRQQKRQRGSRRH